MASMTLNPSVALIFILSFIIVISVAIVRYYNKRMSPTKTGLIVADRSLGKWETSFSIAASWIWAPALFISAQKSYQDGLIGLFWFVVPNVLCLVLFSFFAQKVRREQPNGFTISSYIREKTSQRVQFLYWFTLAGLTICAFSVQLLAGGQLLSRITKIPFFMCTFFLALIPLSYSLFSGLKATIITDFIKMIFVYSIGFILIPWAIISAGGFQLVQNGLGGKINTLNIFGPESLRIFLTFGLPTAIGLLAGPFGDQTFWQRTFAVKKEHVRIVFIKGAFLFVLVPLVMSLLGFAAAGSLLQIKEPQMVNLEFINLNLPPFASWIFVLMILIALISTLDTKLTAISSLGAHDFIKFFTKTDVVEYRKTIFSSRLSMVILSLLAILIANIPDLKIIHLFLFYGTMRSATVLPTILLILKKPLAERGIFYGILFSLLVGLPLFAYGNINQIPSIIVMGSLLTVLSSGIIALIYPDKKDLIRLEA